MKMGKRVLLAAAFLCSFMSLMGHSASVIETNRLEELWPYIDERTLVLVEPENVLMQTTTHLGSEQWGAAKVRELCMQGYSQSEARGALISFWNRVLRDAEVEPVDPGVSAFFRQLQRRKIACMGVTQKDSDIAYVLLDQILSIGIGIERTSPIQGQLVWNTAGYPKKVMHGLFCVGVKNEMGAAVADLLRQISPRPSRIVVISHDYAHVQAICEAVHYNGVCEAIGVRYTGADRRIREYRPDIAALQEKYVGRVLSDEEARTLKSAKWSFWPFN